MDDMFDEREVVEEAAEVVDLPADGHRLARLRPPRLSLGHTRRVAAIAYLFGVVAIVAGMNEFMPDQRLDDRLEDRSRSSRRPLHPRRDLRALAPGDTFATLAGLDRASSCSSRASSTSPSRSSRRMSSSSGGFSSSPACIEIVLAFWVAGNSARRRSCSSSTSGSSRWHGDHGDLPRLQAQVA